MKASPTEGTERNERLSIPCAGICEEGLLRLTPLGSEPMRLGSWRVWKLIKKDVVSPSSVTGWPSLAG